MRTLYVGKTVRVFYKDNKYFSIIRISTDELKDTIILTNKLKANVKPH